VEIWKGVRHERQDDAGARHNGPLRSGIVAALVACCLAQAAEARPARCFTTDDGSFACDFQPTGRDGSFRISARGKPTYILTMEAPGVAYGFVNLGKRNVALPGRYRRSASEPGCWVNDETGTKICAR
jgi:hypothetical protein